MPFMIDFITLSQQQITAHFTRRFRAELGEKQKVIPLRSPCSVLNTHLKETIIITENITVTIDVSGCSARPRC